GAIGHPRRMVDAPGEPLFSLAIDARQHEIPGALVARAYPLALAPQEEDSATVGREAREEIRVRVVRQLSDRPPGEIEEVKLVVPSRVRRPDDRAVTLPAERLDGFPLGLDGAGQLRTCCGWVRPEAAGQASDASQRGGHPACHAGDEDGGR